MQEKGGPGGDAEAGSVACIGCIVRQHRGGEGQPVSWALERQKGRRVPNTHRGAVEEGAGGEHDKPRPEDAAPMR